jgi:mRNA interferase MazF
MEAPARGAVILIRFPYSDLSQMKLRPAVVLADAGRGDWVLCQITSKSYSDAGAVTLEATAFESGSLRIVSFARPGKLFTANQSLIAAHIGRLKPERMSQVVESVVTLLRRG